MKVKISDRQVSKVVRKDLIWFFDSELTMEQDKRLLKSLDMLIDFYSTRVQYEQFKSDRKEAVSKVCKLWQ